MELSLTVARFQLPIITMPVPARQVLDLCPRVPTLFQSTTTTIAELQPVVLAPVLRLLTLTEFLKMLPLVARLQDQSQPMSDLHLEPQPLLSACLQMRLQPLTLTVLLNPRPCLPVPLPLLRQAHLLTRQFQPLTLTASLLKNLFQRLTDLSGLQRNLETNPTRSKARTRNLPSPSPPDLMWI